MKKYHKLLFLNLFLLVMGSLQAQKSVLTSGGNATGAGGSASYSVGQLLTGTGTGSNGSAAPGMQQPFEITEVLGIGEPSDSSFSLTVYPNPSSGFLTLKTDRMDFSSMEYQLLNLSGNFLESKAIEGQQTTVTMQDHVTGVYFLKVFIRNKEIKTFKIIKN